TEENTRLIVALDPSNASSAQSTASSPSSVTSSSVSTSGMWTSAVAATLGACPGRVEVAAETGGLTAHTASASWADATNRATTIKAGRRNGRDYPVFIPRLCGLQLRCEPRPAPGVPTLFDRKAF